jgi:type IV secretion system protein VirB8
MRHESFPPDRAAYFAQGSSWSDDIIGDLKASRQRAYMAAAAAILVAMLEAAALLALAPLKTAVPYAFTVDRQTGYIEIAQPLKPGALAQDEAVVKAFLAQYVLARETFDRTDLQASYDEVAAWTSGAARDQYLAAMRRDNPQSPLNLYDSDTVLKVTIKTIALLGHDRAMMRFDTQRLADGRHQPERRSYSAIIAFRIAGQAMRNQDRFENPLGFQVTQYRRDAEFAGQISAEVP